MLKVLFIFGLALHSHIAIPVRNKKSQVIVDKNVAMEKKNSLKTPSELAVSVLNLPSNSTYIRADITDSRFSCEDKPFALGYYADIENDCQVFYVCQRFAHPNGKESSRRWSFICPEETSFNQEAFTCMRPEDNSFRCDESENFYKLNRKFGMTAEEISQAQSNTEETEDFSENSPLPLQVYTATSPAKTTKHPYLNRRKPTTSKPLKFSAVALADKVESQHEIKIKNPQKIKYEIKHRDQTVIPFQAPQEIKPALRENEKPPNVVLDTKVMEIINENPIEIPKDEKIVLTKIVHEESTLPDKDIENPIVNPVNINESSETDIISAFIKTLSGDDDNIQPEDEGSKKFENGAEETRTKITNLISVPESLESKKDMKVDDLKVDELRNEEQSKLIQPIGIEDVIDLVKESLNSTTNLNHENFSNIVPIYNRDSANRQEDSKIFLISKGDEGNMPIVSSLDSKIIPIEINEKNDLANNKIKRHLKLVSGGNK